MMSKRPKTILTMLMMVAGVFLAACAAEVDADKDRSVLTPDEPKPDESTAPAKDSPGEVTPRVSCRRVTASSIPVFTAPNSNTVLCRFFSGDKFSYFNVVQASGFPARLTTWCPRGVPPAQGTTGYAQISGTVDGGCG